MEVWPINYQSDQFVTVKRIKTIQLSLIVAEYEMMNSLSCRYAQLVRGILWLEMGRMKKLGIKYVRT